MENWEVAAALERMAGLLALKGEKLYMVRAYSRAARQIMRSHRSVHNLLNEGKLTALPGIGAGLGMKIEELVTVGYSSFLNRLESEVSPELLALFSIPNVGYKTAAALKEGLQLENMVQLERAAIEGRITRLPGLGKSLEKSIIRFFQEKDRSGVHRGVAVPLAGQLLRFLDEQTYLYGAEPVGEVRRGSELVSRVTIMAAAGSVLESRRRLDKDLRSLPGITEVDLRQNGFVLHNITGLPVCLFVVDEKEYPIALVKYTGSQSHWDGLVKLAGQKGFTLEEQGLFRRGKRMPLKKETDLYFALDLPFIPPELREGRGEIEDAPGVCPPCLLELDDIRGDLHLHTNWSDGSSSILEMAREGESRGYEYIAITDHSPSLKIAGGLSESKLRWQVQEISSLNREAKTSCRILCGVEVDICSDGSLDLHDDILEVLDVVIASVHSNFRQSREEMTGRICCAMEHPLVHIIGHPTGRLLGSRGSYDVDIDALIRCAAITGTVLEINASPQRLDLDEDHTGAARAAGAKLAVNTDAHSIVTMDDITYGVTAARRGSLEAGDVLNTLFLEELLEALQKKRRRLQK